MILIDRILFSLLLWIPNFFLRKKFELHAYISTRPRNKKGENLRTVYASGGSKPIAAR